MKAGRKEIVDKRFQCRQREDTLGNSSQLESVYRPYRALVRVSRELDINEDISEQCRKPTVQSLKSEVILCLLFSL